MTTETVARKMKILLANPPWYVEPQGDAPGRHGVRAGSRWPHDFEYFSHTVVGGRVAEFSGKYVPFPFWLATAAAILRRDGHEVQLRDSIARGETYESFLRSFKEMEPELLVLETASATLENDLGLIRSMREMRSGLIVVLCGLHSELEQPEFLASHPDVDFCLYGEFEPALRELVRAMSSGDEISKISGLVFRNEAGQAIKNAFGKLVPLEEYPWPERNAEEAAAYNDTASGLPTPQLQVMATRGCPYGCIFCIWPQMLYRSGKYRKRAASDVLDEVEAQMATGLYRSFYIDDDTFNIDKRYVKELCEGIRARGLNKYPWGAMGRADLVDEAQLQQLKAAGMVSVKFGVESADQQILDVADKRIDIDEVVRGVEQTHAAGIAVHLTFTIGLPGDTHETIEKTIQLACTIPCQSVQFSIATPYPGTKMFDMYREKRWLVSQRWNDYVGSTKAVSRTETLSPDDLEHYVRIAQRRYARADAQRKLANTEAVDALVARAKRATGPVVVLQSARVEFTRALVGTMLERGADVHVFTHERFREEFLSILDEERLHTFAETTNFHDETLAQRCESLRARHSFGGSIVPYSHRFRSGYEQVELVARRIGGNIVAGVSLDGEVFG